MLRHSLHILKALALPGSLKRATQTPHAGGIYIIIYNHPTGHLPLLRD
jgi:hypothetical protein